MYVITKNGDVVASIPWLKEASFVYYNLFSDTKPGDRMAIYEVEDENSPLTPKNKVVEDIA